MKQRIGAVLVVLFSIAAIALSTTRPATALDGETVMLGQRNLTEHSTEIVRDDNPANTGNRAVLSLSAVDSTDTYGYNGLSIVNVNLGAIIAARYTGVYAAGGELGLQVDGPVQFSTAGKAFVTRGKSSVTFDLGFAAQPYGTTQPKVDITDESVVLANVRYPYVAGVYVVAAVPNAGSDTVTVYLSKPVTQTTGISYFVMNANGHCEVPGVC
jgi:hypothetical protein